jgi:hypothetical protein
MAISYTTMGAFLITGQAESLEHRGRDSICGGREIPSSFASSFIGKLRQTFFLYSFLV